MSETSRGLPPVILLSGPTASGKSAVALALAGEFPLEIVSVDSAQVFRDMDVGTAKPSAQERAAAPHHLIDILDPVHAYSAARFREDALAAIEAITGRGRIPALVGGTMLYFKALLEGLSDLPPSEPALRAEIDAEAAERGWPALHAELAAVDPATAARLAPTDAQRIQRALEVFRLTGQPMSAQLGRGQPTELPFHPISIGLVPGERALLHRRIEARFESMLHDGLLDELEDLRHRYPLHAGLPAMRCVGYRQAWQVLEGELPHRELRDRGVFATRQLAKRQLTWLRAMPHVTPFDCFAPDLSAQVIAFLRHEIKVD